MSTWAGFIRVSAMNGRQSGVESTHTDRDQTEDIERGVPKDGRLVMLPPEFNISGGLPLERRPSLLAAIEGVERGEYDGVIVAYLSRLGRNVREQLRAWDRVEAAGGRIIVVQEGIDTTKRSGRLQRNLLLSIAEDEREGHAERFDHLRRWNVEQGIWRQRQTPLGYRKGEKPDRRLFPDERAADVRRAFRDRAAGVPISTIARRLGMTTSGVRQLLANRVYLGELRDGGRRQKDGRVSPLYVNPKAHDALVTLEEFEAAQRTIARPSPKGATTDGPALLAGVVRCSGCGHVMSRKRTTSLVYGCPVNHSGQRCPAPAAITCAPLDAHVERIALTELARLTVSASAGRGVENAQATLERAERELTGYLEAISVEDVGAAAFAAGARSRREDVEAAREEMRAELAKRPALPAAGMTGAEAWEGLSAHRRNQLLRAVLHAVVVAPAGRGRRVPLDQRVRVLRHGADVRLPNGPGKGAAGIVPIPLADLDGPDVLRPVLGEDAL